MEMKERMARRNAMQGWNPEPLTVEAVTERIAAIIGYQEATNDNEETHWCDDDLMERALRVVAAGQPDAQAIAQAAVRLREYDYSRWYA